MRLALAVGAVPALALSLAAAPADDAARVHRDAFVFDAHVHMVNRQFYGGGDLGQRQPDGQVDLPRLKEGGYDAFFFSLFVPEEYYPGRQETRQVLRLVAKAQEQLARNRDTVELALTAPDIARINAQGKLAAVLDLEGGFDLDGDLGVLRTLHALGFRSLQLAAHNWGNGFADSCCAPARWNGLNERGREVIREMNRLGMVINVSHASEEAISQALDVSTAPLVATHHGLKHFNDIPRTMSDALLRKLAAKGGVIGFHVGNSFHNRRWFEWQRDHQGKPFWDTSAVEGAAAGLSVEKIDALIARRPPDMRMESGAPELLMSVDQWVDVVDYAIGLVGEDHVALGSDWDGGPTPPRGMRDARDIGMITEAMLRRGYSQERIGKFLGGNLLRVFRQVTEGAAATPTYAPLFFREDWAISPAATPLSQEHVANPDLVLTRHGPAQALIKKSHHDQPADDPYYVWSGDADGNWAVSLRHRASAVDLTGPARIRWRARQSGFRALRVLLQLGDGKWVVSEEADGPADQWRVFDLPLRDVRWRALDIEKVVEGRPVASPDLSRVRQVGFTDLMRGGGTPASSRLDWIEVYGRAVPLVPAY